MKDNELDLYKESAEAWKDKIVHALKKDRQGMNRFELRDAIKFPLGTKKLMAIVDHLVEDGVLDYTSTELICVAGAKNRAWFFRKEENDQAYKDMTIFFDWDEINRYKRFRQLNR